MFLRFPIFVAAALLAGCSTKSSGPGVEPFGTGGGGGAVPQMTSGSGGDPGAGGSAAPATSSGGGGSSLTGSGGGGLSCDSPDSCGDMSSGCIGCAFAGACADDVQACYADQDCSDYQGCFDGCKKGDSVCIDGCAAQHPAGAAEFAKLYNCAVCDHCAKACDAAMACSGKASGARIPLTR